MNQVWREQNPDYFKGRYEIMLKDCSAKDTDHQPQYRLEYADVGKEVPHAPTYREAKDHERILSLARLLVEVAQQQMPEYASKFAPKRYTQPSLLACLCLKAYLHLDYRSTEALLANTQELRAVLGLRVVPDHSTLWLFSRRKVRPSLLDQVLTATLRLFSH